MRMPDSPALISLNLLAKMDAEQPGTYLASMKVDGRRRICTLDKGRWTWSAKNRTDSQPVPAELREEFESLMADSFRCGVTLDCEWTGLRQSGDAGGIFVFDILALAGEWLQAGYLERWKILRNMSPLVPRDVQQDIPVWLLRVVPNPGMVDFFQQQLMEPLSEGIVVRRSDQVNIGAHDRSATNPMMWKCKFSRLTEKGRV